MQLELFTTRELETLLPQRETSEDPAPASGLLRALALWLARHPGHCVDTIAWYLRLTEPRARALLEELRRAGVALTSRATRARDRRWFARVEEFDLADWSGP